jgi:hypothetical protein
MPAEMQYAMKTKQAQITVSKLPYNNAPTRLCMREKHQQKE